MVNSSTPILVTGSTPFDIRSARVIQVLARLVSKRGAPLYLRSDNGPEFVSQALLKWIVDQGIATALIDPGKPWQNGTAESFNGKFRDECLSLERFRSRAEAKVVIETRRRHYNEVRPHSSLGYLTPACGGSEAIRYLSLAQVVELDRRVRHPAPEVVAWPILDRTVICRRASSHGSLRRVA